MMCAEEVIKFYMSVSLNSSCTVSCPQLPTIGANGGFTCTTVVMSSTYYFEATCSVSCDLGYEVIGDEIWTCQSDGSWNASVATCGTGICSYYETYMWC